MKLTTSLFFLPVAGVFGSGTGAELHLAANSLIAQPALGTIQGSVKDENGSPIRGATVLYRRITPVPRSGIAPAGDVAVHRLIDSDDNGALIAPNLPVG